MAIYLNLRTLKPVLADITVGNISSGEITLMVHLTNHACGIRLSRSEAVELAMLLMKHASSPPLEKVA